jgi:hypothetical protein
MCIGGGGSPPPATTPAPPPPQPEANPNEPAIGSKRKGEEKNTFGSGTPSMRVDRSATGGGAGAGGSGIKM